MPAPDPGRPALPPYLGPFAIASLAFTSPLVISLLLVIMRLVLAINSAHASVDSAKLKLAASCLGLEQAASVAVSFPHYMAENVNEVTAAGAEAIVHGLGTVLDMSVLAVEKILIFVIDMYRSMYLCLADLVVRGGMALAIGATQEFSEFFNNTVASVKTELQSALAAADNALDSAIEGINRLPGVDIPTPNINPDLAFLDNVGIPSDFLNALVNLNASMPTLDELKDKMNGFIAIPFEELRGEIGRNLGNVSVDRGLFPVPEKDQLAFCETLEYSFVDDVGHTLVKTAQYGIILIVALIFLYILAMVYIERRFYAGLEGYVEITRAHWMSDLGFSSGQSQHPYFATSNGGSAYVSKDDVERTLSTPVLLGFLGNSRNPILRSVVPKLTNRIPALRRSARACSNLNWFIAYITYLPCLLLLALALLGLLSVEIQLAALKPTEKSAQKQVDSGLGDFKADVLARINNVTAEKSAAYAAGSNHVLLTVQDGINNDMFGWVNGTTTTINTTINEVYSEITGAIDTTFRGSVFEAPALQVVHCLIGSKVEALSTALTWLHDNAHVTLPMVKDDIFLLAPARSNELVSSLDGGAPSSNTSTVPPPSSAQRSAPTTSASSDSGSLIQTLIGQYRSALEQERTMFLAMLGLYGLVVLFGIIALLWNQYGRPRWSARRKRNAAGGRESNGLKELALEKTLHQPARNQEGEVVNTTRMRGGSSWASESGRFKGAAASVGALLTRPLERLNGQKRKQRHVIGTPDSELSFTNVQLTPSRSRNAPTNIGRAFSPPPPAYPVWNSTSSNWPLNGEQEQSVGSTVSLIGALDLPSAPQSRGSYASETLGAAPSSAGLSPHCAGPAEPAQRQQDEKHIQPQEYTLQVPTAWLYGASDPGISPPRPVRRDVAPAGGAAAENPFATCFDAPDGR